MINNSEKLKQFLEENNLEIVSSIKVKNQDLFDIIKPGVIQSVLSCIKAEYELKEKVTK